MRNETRRAGRGLPCASLAGLLLLTALPLAAAPAPWYVWRSRLNGSEHCAQVAPGTGWMRVRGPFRDLRCQPLAGERRPAARPDPRFDPGQLRARSPATSGARN